MEQKRDKGGIFDKKESDSDVEEFMEDLENDEMELDGLKLPSDEDEDEDDEDGPGLDDYDDEEDFGEGIRDDYEDEEGGDARRREGDSEDGEDEEDNEAELDDVFAQANKNQEMDVVENLRRQADENATAKNEDFINSDLVKKIEQIEDEMMNPKPW